MKRDAGIMAGLAAVLVLVGLTGRQSEGPSAPSGGTSGEQTTSYRQPRRAAKPGASQQGPPTPCTEIVSRLERFTAVPANELDAFLDLHRLPAACYDSNDEPPRGLAPIQAPHVRFAIALVPDPLSTHLPLLFDQIIESLQQAAQDDGYTYDGSWFPWDTNGNDYADLSDQLDAERLRNTQEAQPGVMVFRRALNGKEKNPDDRSPYADGLAVFIVGEQPTGGVRDEQFDNALDWLLLLQNASQISQEPLRILGPSFSGSLPSLRCALERNLGLDTPNDSPCSVRSAEGETLKRLRPYARPGGIKVSSGNVSSPLSYNWFKNWVQTIGGTFITTQESDSLLTRRFCRYLDQQKYSTKLVAELSEDETAFGTWQPPAEGETGQASGEQTPCPALSLYYPRDISNLRSAYQQQSIFGSNKTQTSSQGPSTRLRGDLSEPTGGRNDSVRHYGGQPAPIEQEAILTQIAHQLADKRIQFVILRGTNSLDDVFLSEFLREAYPEARVVIDGVDLIYTEGSWGGSLRGVMLLSTYPLLTQEADWTSSLLSRPTGAYRTFSVDASEGLYVAARELLRDSANQPGVSIHDYSPPAWARDPDVDQPDNDLPPTWITVISHREFWPVAALDDYTLGINGCHGSACPARNSGNLGTILLTPESRGDGRPVDRGQSLVPEFPIATWLVFIGCLGWACIHWWFCAFPSMVRLPRARAYFVPLSRWEHPALITLGSFLLATFAVVAAGCTGWFASLMSSSHPGAISYQDPWTELLLACWFAVVISSSSSGILLNYRIAPQAGGAEPGIDFARAKPLAFALGFAAWVLVLVVYVDLINGLTAANAVPVYWRNVNLLSGVSGLLPQALLLAGMYAWFWCRLRSLAHFGDDRPLLPTTDDLGPMMRMFSGDGVGRDIEEEARPLGKNYLRAVAIALPGAIFGCGIALQDWSVRTLGERRFGVFMFFWLCLSIAIIMANTLQLSLVWTRLRSLLVHLDLLRLRRTLRNLKGLEWGSPWKVSGNVLEQRYRLISLEVESLRNLKNALGARFLEEFSERDEIRPVLAAIDTCLNDPLARLANHYVAARATGMVTDLVPVKEFQQALARVAGLVLQHILLPGWRLESASLILGYPAADRNTDRDETDPAATPGSVKPHVRAAEEFFVLPYLAFIQNVLGRLRAIVLGTLWLFLGTTLAFASYPFQPLNILGGIFLAVFVLVGGVTVVTFAQMWRDATLSHITDTKPGELGWEFWLRIAGFGVGPLLGLLTTLFPSITEVAFSWFRPGMEALK